MTEPPSDVGLKDVDVYMLESMDRYLNNDNFGGWFAEYNAVSIIFFLVKKEKLDTKVLEDARKIKAVLLNEEDLAKFKKITSELSTALFQQRSSKRELEQFEKNNYENFIAWYGQAKADERKNELTKKRDKDLQRYTSAKEAYDNELNIIKKGAPKRASDYIALRGTAFAESNEDPVVILNKVLYDVNNAYPEYSFQASDMNEQVKNLYGNYKTDSNYMNSIHTLLKDLSNNLVPSLEKKKNYKDRKQEIQEYYHKQYDQQIFLVKILIFFSLFVIVGSVLLHYEIIPMTIFAIYLGVVASVAFVVFFYYLWDFYIRDTDAFDEYNFNVYSPPSNGLVLRGFKDNIIYC